MNKKENILEAQDIIDLALQLKTYATAKKMVVSDEAALKTAADIYFNNTTKRLNEILVSAFAVSDKFPSALEAIAVQLGFSSKMQTETLPSALNNIAEQILANR
jgi:hypothetical protein